MNHHLQITNKCKHIAIIAILFINFALCAEENHCPVELVECDCVVTNGLMTIDCAGKALTDLPNLFGAEVQINPTILHIYVFNFYFSYLLTIWTYPTTNLSIFPRI